MYICKGKNLKYCIMKKLTQKQILKRAEQVTTLSPIATKIQQDLETQLKSICRYIISYNGDGFEQESTKQQFKQDLLEHLWNRKKEIFLYFNNDEYDLVIEGTISSAWEENYRRESDIKLEYPETTVYLMID